jgi:hypothetical protein
MEDYTSNVLTDSKNEWSILLMNYLTPHVIDGFRSIFNESVQLCEQNDELEKYLMTFQNLLSRIPKWNNEMIRTEKERIMKLCNCSYLEDLMTCVHIIQLKILSCVRVGNESKKITIDIPDFGSFLHKVYINVARKLYSNIYLFEIDIPSLDIQKRNREFEVIVQACIMNTIRDSIPVETLLRQYIDESTEYEVRRESDATRSEATKSDATKSDATKSDATKSDTTRSDATKSDATKSEIKEVTPVATSPVIPIEMKPLPQVVMPPVVMPPVEMRPLSNEFKNNISFNDQLETFEIPIEDESIRIGEDIPLNMLSFEDLEKATPYEIDLGIVEL